MYTIEVKDDSKEKVYIVCPSLISMKDWIYTMLLRAMREDIALDVCAPIMREILSHYTTQMINLDDFDDEVGCNSFSTYHDTRYVVKYNPDECLKTVNII